MYTASFPKVDPRFNGPCDVRDSDLISARLESGSRLSGKVPCQISFVSNPFNFHPPIEVHIIHIPGINLYSKYSTYIPMEASMV